MSGSEISFDTVRNALQNIGEFSATTDFDLNKDIAPKPKELRQAAVLLPMIERNNGLNLVLTKRAATMRNHPGQIAFPGGKVDASDMGPEAAAIREAHEEVGLEPEKVEILGALPNHQTITGFDIFPFAAQITSDFIAKPETGEVDEIFEVPLSHVLNPRNFLIEGRLWGGQMRYYYVVPYGPYYIWGATARMLRMFAHQIEVSNAN